MLKKIAKRITKEVEQAEDYAEQACLVKMAHRDLAELFLELSREEIEHAEKLFEMGFKMLNKRVPNLYTKEGAKETDGAISEAAKEVWQWQYRLMSDRIEKIKYKNAHFDR